MDRKTIQHCWLVASLTLLLAIMCGCSPTKATAPPAQSTLTLWQQCAICHGTGEMQRGPILDGMPSWAVEHQLHKFAAGIRGKNPKNRGELLMGGAIDKIPNEIEIKRLSAYVASLPKRSHIRVVKGDLSRGGALYAARCASCHGDKAEGKRLLKAPPLDFLEDWFVADQLRKFASGRRGIHPDDKDGQAMAAASQGLTQVQIRDLAAWIATQQLPR